MRKSIFMYLFFFAVLFIVFQYANEKTIWEAQDTTIENLSLKLEKAQDSISGLSDTLADATYFSLQGNENALEYIERLGLEATDIQAIIYDQIYDKNGAVGGNPIIPMASVNGNFKINKIKLLNSRWIQADFSDGDNWGELIIEYFFNQDNTIELVPLSSFLYSLK
ncbi:MAG: hydrolase [Patiriisocius sp.]